MLEINHGGGKSRKTPAVRAEVEEVAVVLGFLRLVLGVEEEEGFVAVLLHRSAWRRGVHGVGATELVPVVASGDRNREKGEREEEEGKGIEGGGG